MAGTTSQDESEMTRHIVSKQRVADHGEVFTSPREVNAMLDLVRHETERIESRFLEPACGTGNFLSENAATSRFTNCSHTPETGISHCFLTSAKRSFSPSRSRNTP